MKQIFVGSKKEPMLTNKEALLFSKYSFMYSYKNYIPAESIINISGNLVIADLR